MDLTNITASIRVDTATQQGSVIDVIRLVNPDSGNNAGRDLQRQRPVTDEDYQMKTSRTKSKVGMRRLDLLSFIAFASHSKLYLHGAKTMRHVLSSNRCSG